MVVPGQEELLKELLRLENEMQESEIDQEELQISPE
jgi:hypothetical protein